MSRGTGKYCWYCGVTMSSYPKSEVRSTKDHVLARSGGGSDSWVNIVPCCRTCNRRKAAMSLEEWRKIGPTDGSGKFWAERHFPQQAARRFAEWPS